MIFKDLKVKKKGDIFSELSFTEKVVESDVVEVDEECSKNLPQLSGMELPDHYVAIPHYLSQSAIYAPRSGDREIIVKRMDLWSQGDMNVAYEGPLLDTKIDNKLMSLVLKARDLNAPGDNLVRLKYKETMKTLGLRPSHPNSRKKFNASLARHLEAKFFFSMGDESAGFWKTFFNADGTVFNYEENILHIQVSDIMPKLYRLKDSGSFSIEDIVLNLAMKGSYTSKLYSYYESNEVPFPVKVSTLLDVCDKRLEINKKPTNNHRKVLKEGLDELQKLGFLIEWSFDTSIDKRDPLVIVKKLSKKERLKNKDNSKFKLDYIYGIRK